MLTFLLWCFLFVICWPVALLALVLYPLVCCWCCLSASWELRCTGFWNWCAR